VIVPTPGDITIPSPIKSLKAPPSNAHVKKPPAVTKIFVPNQFDDEEYLKFKNTFCWLMNTKDTAGHASEFTRKLWLLVLN
jgi:hypothetical protein